MKYAYVVTSTHTYDHEPTQSTQAVTSVLGIALSPEGVEKIVQKNAKGATISWNNDKESARVFGADRDIEVQREELTLTDAEAALMPDTDGKLPVVYVK